MRLPGAEAQGLSRRQCLELVESAQDILASLASNLRYLINEYPQNTQINAEQVSTWVRLQDEALNIQLTLAEADVTAYQQAIYHYGQLNRELRRFIDICVADQPPDII